MWIKSLDTDVWINMTHITHFSIVGPTYDNRIPDHEVYAFLDASANHPTGRTLEPEPDQASLMVYQGTYEECDQFIKEQIGLQTAWQWLGYLVAGGVGAVLTLLFS